MWGQKVEAKCRSKTNVGAKGGGRKQEQNKCGGKRWRQKAGAKQMWGQKVEAESRSKTNVGQKVEAESRSKRNVDPNVGAKCRSKKQADPHVEQNVGTKTTYLKSRRKKKEQKAGKSFSKSIQKTA